MRRRRRGNWFVTALGNVVLAAVGGAGVMFLALRLGLVPASVLGTGPAQTAVSFASFASTPATVGVPSSVAGTPTVAASATTPEATPIPRTPAAATAPTPVPTRPPAGDAARRWLQAWEQQRYPDMYRQLSASAKATIAEDRFLTRYQAITIGATINSLKTAVQAAPESGGSAVRYEAPYKVTFQTGRLGEFSEDNTLPLVFEGGEWKVDWAPGLIFRDLTPDRVVRFVPDDPVRGAIVDRNGAPLAAQGRIVTLGVVPGRIKDQNQVVSELSKFLGTDPDVIRAKLAPAKPDWWVPFRDFPLDRREELTRRFAAIDGVLAEEKDGRVYPAGAVMAHVVGFVSPANPEDLKKLAAKGYEEGDLVGRAGVELWADEILAGVHGGRLSIVDSAGETIRVVAERPAKNGGTIQLTIDTELQRQGDRVLGDRVGSLVIMDPRDNSVAALVSKPTYDPNGFITGFSEEEWKKLADDPRRPFQARATMSTYATGSVFKVVTMAAGLERGGFQPNAQFNCGGQWGVTELNVKRPFGDWKPQGHGRLDLSQGLVESCNIVFYEIGNKLNNQDPNLLTEFGRKFGFGEPTGIQGIPESSGIVPGPEWKKKELRQEWFPGDAVNYAIGQGFLDATPLQVANAYAALANGGVLRTPLLLKKVTPADNTPGKELQSEERWRLPVSGDHLAVIRDAMKRVAATPKGTANYAFGGYKIPIAAKTGSAENERPEAHAWFAGFGPADEPRAVIVVMIEGGEQGGTVAAPVARQAFEVVLGK